MTVAPRPAFRVGPTERCAALDATSHYHCGIMSGPVIEALQDVLSRHPELELAFVFGSAALGAERTDSDVDIAVQAARPLDASRKMALVGDFAAATGRAVDLIDLRTVGEPLLGQILAHGRRLRGSDDAHGRLLSRHLIEAADFLPYAQRILDERRRAWIGK